MYESEKVEEISKRSRIVQKMPNLIYADTKKKNKPSL